MTLPTPRRRSTASKVAGRVGQRVARRALLHRSHRWGRPEKRTAALAVVTLATVGGVAVTELGRVFKRTAERRPDSDSWLETAEHALPQAAAVAAAGYEAAPSRENALFNMLSAFVITFAVVRLSTWGIRNGWWPFRNLSFRGRHIHHFLPGILLSFASGGIALVTRNDDLEPLLAVPFGVGMGLTFDEFALLLDLEDVYWTREGLVSVQISLGLAALLSATILALRIIRRGEAVVLEPGPVSAVTVTPNGPGTQTA